MHVLSHMPKVVVTRMHPEPTLGVDRLGGQAQHLAGLQGFAPEPWVCSREIFNGDTVIDGDVVADVPWHHGVG